MSNNIEKSIKDYISLCKNLLESEHNNYNTYVQRFLNMTERDENVKHIINTLKPTLNNYDEYYFVRQNGWGDLRIPTELDDHIQMLILLYRDLSSGKISLIQFTLTFFKDTNINTNVNRFNDYFVKPALEEILNRLNEQYEKTKSVKKSDDSKSIVFTNYGTIHNEQGNLGVGTNISMENKSSYEKLPEEFALALLQNGFTLKDIDVLRDDIEELKLLLVQQKPDESKIKNIFKKVLSVGGNLMVGILANIISRPEITSAIIASL